MGGREVEGLGYHALDPVGLGETQLVLRRGGARMEDDMVPDVGVDVAVVWHGDVSDGGPVVVRLGRVRAYEGRDACERAVRKKNKTQRERK